LNKQNRDGNITWSWEGDTFALRGFNVAITPYGGNPNSESIAKARVEASSRSYTFENITINADGEYQGWVQAIYEGGDSAWQTTGKMTLPDDGTPTIVSSTDGDTIADETEQNAKEYFDSRYIKDEDELIHFDEHLTSTNGMAPDNDYTVTLRDDGKFKGGVAVEEATENLVVNPQEWKIKHHSSYQTVTILDETLFGCVISEAEKVSDGTPATQVASLNIANGETYTASIYSKTISSTSSGNAKLIFYNGSYLASVYATKDGQWERLEVTYTNDTGEDLNNVYIYYYPPSKTGSISQASAPQLEKKPLSTSFTESIRDKGKLNYPINTDNKTINFYRKGVTSLVENTGEDFSKGTLTDVEVVNNGLELGIKLEEDFINDLSKWTKFGEDAGSISLSNGELTITNEGTGSQFIGVRSNVKLSVGESFEVRSKNTEGRHSALIAFGESPYSVYPHSQTGIGLTWYARAADQTSTMSYKDENNNTGYQENGITENLTSYQTFKIVRVDSSTVELYRNDVLEHTFTGLTFNNDYYVYFSADDYTTPNTIIVDWVNINNYKPQGTRQSPQLNLSDINNVTGSLIEWESDYNEHALSFDGVNDYVDIGTNWNNFSDLTLRFDFLCNSINQSGENFLLGSENFIEIGNKDGTIQFAINNTSPGWSFVDTGVLFPVNKKTSLTFVYNSSECKIYLDGTNVYNSTSLTGDIINNMNPSGGDTLTIGCKKISGSSLSLFFDGRIEKTLIWNKSLTETEIQNNINIELTGTETGLVAYYKISEGTGTTLYDSAGANDGTVYGATWERLITADVETSVDGGTNWTQVLNKSSVPDITTADTLDIRQVLTTNDTTITPTLSEVKAYIFTDSDDEYKMYTIIPDGTAYLNGTQINAVPNAVIDITDPGKLKFKPNNIYDEVLIKDGDVTEEDINNWYELGKPFEDNEQKFNTSTPTNVTLTEVND